MITATSSENVNFQFNTNEDPFLSTFRYLFYADELVRRPRHGIGIHMQDNNTAL